jgi:hypothetical protein
VALADILSAGQRRAYRRGFGITSARQLPRGLAEQLHQYGLLGGGRTVDYHGSGNADQLAALQKLGAQYQQTVAQGQGPGARAGGVGDAGASTGAPVGPVATGGAQQGPAIPAGYEKFGAGAAAAYARRQARRKADPGLDLRNPLGDAERRFLQHHGGLLR